ncbi:SOUL family heme-binding protein [Halohasta salina]|uniref:SOUL family heme-binding protein n=1 Tax=Halohasta salina TaxID=2961621 RepID=UPI0020A3D3B8|nr:heme-binding protein [Halohasta salina]
MDRATTFVTGVVSGLAALAGWRYYRSRATESVDYEVRRLVDGVEIRRYPTVVVAETVAASEAIARRRLREYAAGANRVGAELPATTPLRTRIGPLEAPTPTGTEASTAPVRVGSYLPPGYSPEAAPEPTDRAVLLTVETPRTVAVRSVPRYPPTDRVGRAKRRLLEGVDRAGLAAVGSPFLFSYDNSLLGSLTGRAEVGIEIA